MDEHSGAPVAEDGDDVARLVALTERQHDLWALLRDAQNEQTRNRLFDELSANREELADLKDKVSAEVDAPRTRPPNDRPDSLPDAPRSVGEELRSRILTPDEVAPSSPPPPPPAPPPVVEISEVVEDSRVAREHASTVAAEEPATAAPTEGSSRGLPGVARMSGADPEKPPCQTVPRPM